MRLVTICTSNKTEMFALYCAFRHILKIFGNSFLLLAVFATEIHKCLEKYKKIDEKIFRNC